MGAVQLGFTNGEYTARIAKTRIVLFDLAQRLTAEAVSGRVVILPAMNYPALTGCFPAGDFLAAVAVVVD